MYCIASFITIPAGIPKKDAGRNISHEPPPLIYKIKTNMWVNIGIIKDQIHHNLLPTTMHKYQIWPLAPEIETTKVKEKYQIWSLAPEIEARKNKERNFFYAKQEYIFFPADSSCRLLVSGSNPCVSGGDASRTREKLVALRLDLGLRPESEKGWNEGKIGGIRTSIAAGVFFSFFFFGE